MLIPNHNFEIGDLVEFVGREAESLKREGKCTTGVVGFSPDSSPYVRIELDTEEGSGKGGGTVQRLAAFNWHIIGAPIRLTLAGTRRQIHASTQRMIAEMDSRPAHLRNPKLRAALQEQLESTK